MKTSATQTQATTSRRRRWPMVTESASCGCLRSLFCFASALTFHRYGALGRVFPAIGAGCCGYPIVGAATFADFQLDQVGRIVPSITRRAVAFLGVIYGAFQIGQRNVTKRIGAEEFADLLGRAGGGDELFASRRVNAVVARGNRRRAADAHVDFFCADFANHAHDFAAGGAADERVVDEDDALAFEQAADGVEFEFDAEIADGLRGFDEGATDVMIADQAHAERDAGFESVADGGGNAGVRNGDDDVGVNRMLLREQAAEGFAALVDAAAEDDAVGAREVDMFEDALLVRFFGREAD